ncbi:MAG: hypothetical protein ACK4JF_01755 [Methylohalobius sp.]
MAHENLAKNMTKPESMMGMGSMMEGMGEMMEMCPMMMGEMGKMMEPMAGMGTMMMGNPASPMKPAAAIAVVTASTNPGKSLVKRLARNPWVWFGLGVVAGILIHRYRKEIIATAVKAGEKGKDFILQQKESLEDIVAETQEKK